MKLNFLVGGYIRTFPRGKYNFPNFFNFDQSENPAACVHTVNYF